MKEILEPQQGDAEGGQDGGYLGRIDVDQRSLLGLVMIASAALIPHSLAALKRKRPPHPQDAKSRK